jgi:hypothetical protein
VALSASVLSGLIRTKALAAGAPLNAVDGPALTALCDCIAQAVVEHVVAAAVVTIPPGVAVATTGTAAAQAGATTAPGVGTVT